MGSLGAFSLAHSACSHPRVHLHPSLSTARNRLSCRAISLPFNCLHSSSLSPAVAFSRRPPWPRFGHIFCMCPVVYTGSTALPADAPIVRHRSSCLVHANSCNLNRSPTVTASMTIASGPLWGRRYVGLPSGSWRQFCRVLKNLPLQGPGSTGSRTGGYQAAALKFGV
jgi:hypothetical protein